MVAGGKLHKNLYALTNSFNVICHFLRRSVFFPGTPVLCSKSTFSYFVSNVKIMNSIILPKEEIHCSIYLWQMRMLPLGTVLSQLLFGGKGQYTVNRYTGFIQTTENLCRVTLVCESLSVPREAVGQIPLISLSLPKVVHYINWTERVK